MSTNLINNYIEQKQSLPQSSDKMAAHSSKKELIKPDKAHGRLIKNSLLDIPSDVYKSTKYDIKALRNSIKGESTDHQLGKVNDLGMKIGGLAIAAFLFTQKQTPKTKWMEIVGFGSFFASMALWPKLALQAPAKAIHGFNVQQKYEDSMGRKKSFFADAQYLPWDLYSDEEINKIGDRLGVDKNINNRREFIQEKMKKIATQNNTMWMLTAGFATPIMSALISSEVEKYLAKAQDKLKDKKAESQLINIESEAAKINLAKDDKAFTAFLNKNANQAINEDLIDDLAKKLAPTLDPTFRKGLILDLKTKYMAGSESFILDENAAETIAKGIEKDLISRFEKTSPEYFERVKQIIPTKEMIIDKLTNRELFGKEIDLDKVTDARRFIKEIVLDAAAKPELRFDEDDTDHFIDVIQENLDTNVKKNQTNILKNREKELSVLRDSLREFEKNNKVAKAYSYNKLSSAPESVSANLWNEKLPKLIKIFGITDKEIENAKIDRLPVQKLMREKFEQITTDDARYQKVVSQIGELINEINEKITSKHINHYCEVVDNIHNKSAANLISLGFDNAANQLNGHTYTLKQMEILLDKLNSGNLNDRNDAMNKIKTFGVDEDQFKNIIKHYKEVKNSEKIDSKELQKIFNSFKGFNTDEIGSIKKIKKQFASNRILDFNYAFFRTLVNLDLFKRITDKNFGGSINEKMKTEIIEEIIEATKVTAISGHASDYANKIFMLRNPEPSVETGLPKIVNGKVVEKFRGKTKGVNLGYDSKFFQNMMKFMYTDGLSTKTEKALGEKLKNDLSKYREDFKKVIDDFNPFKLGHKISSGHSAATSEEKFKLISVATDELFTKLFNQKYNTNKWMKIFGSAAIGLTGITVLSQFFFGKMPDPKKMNKDNV